MYGRLGIEWAINYGYIQMSMQEQEGGRVMVILKLQFILMGMFYRGGRE